MRHCCAFRKNRRAGCVSDGVAVAERALRGYAALSQRGRSGLCNGSSERRGAHGGRSRMQADESSERSGSRRDPTRRRQRDRATRSVTDAPGAAILVSATGEGLHCNDSWTDLVGQRRPHSMGVGWLQALPTVSRVEALEAVAMASHEPSIVTARWRLADPAPGHPNEVTTRLRRASDGNVVVTALELPAGADANPVAPATHDRLTGMFNRSVL